MIKKTISIVLMLMCSNFSFGQTKLIDSLLNESAEFKTSKNEIESAKRAHEILAGQTDKIHDTADLLISWSGVVFTIFTILLGFASIYTGMQLNEIRKLKDSLTQIILESKKKLEDQSSEIQNIKDRFEREKETSLKLLFPLIEGQWNFYQGNYKKALELFKEVHEIEPNHPRILKQYYWLLTNTGKILESINKLELLAKQYPNDNDIKLRLSVAYRRNNQFENAESIVKELVEKEHFVPAYYDYGSILLRKRDFENAEKMFVDANRYFSENGEVPKYWIFLNLAITQIALTKRDDAQRNTQNAVSIIESKISKTPSNPHLYLSLGIAKLLLDKNDVMALKLVNEAISKDLPIEHAKSIIEKLKHIKEKLDSEHLIQVINTLDKYYLDKE